MPASRSLKNVMRGAKSLKKGTNAPGDGSMSVLRAGKQYKQTGNKKSPKSQSGSDDYDGDEGSNMKLIV